MIPRIYATLFYRRKSIFKRLIFGRIKTPKIFIRGVKIMYIRDQSKIIIKARG